MAFKYQTDVPTEDGKGTKKVTFTLKDMKQMPSGILRRNRRDELGLTFEALEWGLSGAQFKDIDRMDMTSLMKMFLAWQSDLEPESGYQDKPSGPPPKPKSASATDAED